MKHQLNKVSIQPSTKQIFFTRRTMHMKPNDIHEVFQLLQKQIPSPKSELNYRNNFELICAVVLSAQTTDAQVNKVTPDLFRVAPDPMSMVALGVENIAKLISCIGLFKAKASYLYGLSEKLITDFNGEVPKSEKELLSLPGVGIKTARVVQNIAFGCNVIAVDTHIFRVMHRLDISRAKTPDKMSDDLVKKIPKEFLHDAHHYIILHGRYTCTARNPKCGDCCIAALCRSCNK